jgi:hypothetical protein
VARRTSGLEEVDSRRGGPRLTLDYHQDEVGEVEKL